jgi:ribonuclease-3
MKDIEDYIKEQGLVPNDLSLYQVAVTHPSYKGFAKTKADYRSLSLIGTKLFEAMAAEKITKENPEIQAKELYVTSSRLASEASIAKIAQNEGLFDYLLIGTSLLKNQNEIDIKNNPAIMSNALTAIIGAITIDCGFYAAIGYVGRLLDSASFQPNALSLGDYKTKLQEIVLAKVHHDEDTGVTYSSKWISGNANSPIYECTIFVKGIQISKGTANSKKRAEMEAAKNALTVGLDKLKSVIGPFEFPPAK